MQTLIAGQKIGVADGLTVSVSLSYSGEIDVSCFGVDANGQLSDERYFIFYNQLSSPEGAIVKKEGAEVFTLALDRLPPSIERLVFTAAVDGVGSMAQLGPSQLSIAEGMKITAVYDFNGTAFERQRAIILCELYRRNGAWRLSVVGNGFDGGLSALLAHFGGEEVTPQAQDTPAPAVAAAPKVSLTKSEAVQKVVLEKAPQLASLTEKAILSLEKKNLADVAAQVVLVLDNSGSMYWQYSNGQIQRLLDKVLPLALMFDDNGALESWVFADRYLQLEDATVDNIAGYIECAGGGWENWSIGSLNNEPGVMEAVYRKHKNDSQPVYVLFVSDGGVYKNNEIKDLVKKAARAPLFWQFVGIGGQDYGILEKLDTMRGRYVDNANFFALDDIDSISDEALYDRLMGEFPQWLKAAKAKRIL